MKKANTSTVSATTTTDNKSEIESRDIREVSNAAAPQYDRGKFNEILLESLTEELRKAVNELVRKAGSAGHVDEHGSWDFGVEYDRKRGECSSLNWDAYGIGRDCHTGQLLALVQVRQFHRKKTGYWPSISKNYFLLGTNEDASIFAHSVSANVVHAAIRRRPDVIKAVQDWIFEGDYAGILRQGDLAMIPCTRRPSAPRGAQPRHDLGGQPPPESERDPTEWSHFREKPQPDPHSRNPSRGSGRKPLVQNRCGETRRFLEVRRPHGGLRATPSHGSFHSIVGTASD